jgi:hypothetical protein
MINKEYMANHKTHFLSFVAVGLEDECWLWKGSTRKDGRYGIFHAKGRPEEAHICSYLLHKGEIPKGMLVHHTCRNKLCVNPKHLELSTNRDHPDNIATIARNKTHCIRGHEFTASNTRTWTRPDGSTKRICRACEPYRKGRIARCP